VAATDRLIYGGSHIEQIVNNKQTERKKNFISGGS